MTDDIHYLTPEGFKEYEERLNFLRSVRRQEVAERLRPRRSATPTSIQGTDWTCA